MSQSQQPNIQEDKALVRRIRQGDMRAYEQLVQKYKVPLTYHIQKLNKGRGLTEDLVQEVFIKAFENINSYKDDYAFSTWIYRIATNHTIDFLRKKKIEAVSIHEPMSTKDGEIESREIPDEQFATDAPMLSNQRSEILHQAIQKLPEKYREVIRLRHMLEMNYDEISQELSIPLGTVKAHLFRAREMLYKQLKDAKDSF